MIKYEIHGPQPQPEIKVHNWAHNSFFFRSGSLGAWNLFSSHQNCLGYRKMSPF